MFASCPLYPGPANLVFWSWGLPSFQGFVNALVLHKNLLGPLLRHVRALSPGLLPKAEGATGLLRGPHTMRLAETARKNGAFKETLHASGRCRLAACHLSVRQLAPLQQTATHRTLRPATIPCYCCLPPATAADCQLPAPPARRSSPAASSHLDPVPLEPGGTFNDPTARHVRFGADSVVTLSSDGAV